jgi:SagB-type dehydrogenase family enzyme
MQMLAEYCVASRRDGLETLRLALLSGDWIPLDLPDKLRQLADPIEVISLGGATEASIWSIHYPVGAVDPAWPSIPYGRPLANQRFYVLDDALQERPDWVPGQLFIGGKGVAQGYWKDPEKTSASFIVHPRTKERLYRTGDLGRQLPAGYIEFLGREDLQVKVGGYRIELGEIEAALREHPEIREAIVLALGEAGQDRRLAGYVITESGGEIPVPDLRAFLRRRIPEYMVPQVFRFMGSFPVTANGKVDRKALPDPFATRAHETPRAAGATSGSETARLLEAVGGVLNQRLEPADLDRNLLELGANSLDLVKIAGIIEDTFGVRPKLQDFLRLPNLGSVVEHVRSQGAPAAQPAEAVLRDAGQEIAGGFEILLEQEDRDAFRAARHGLRADAETRVGGGNGVIRLARPGSVERWREAVLQRRSHREFARRQLAADRLGALLACLQQIELEGKPKLWYGSAGSLYPVQTYLYVKPLRVGGLAQGTHYYHPARHCLIPIDGRARISSEIFTLANQDIFDAAAFALFLIGKMEAILPMYGEMSRDLCLIEAGLMSQLLETVAPDHGIGLCQIGRCEFSQIRSSFGLGEMDVYLHCLLGGGIPRAEAASNAGARGTIVDVGDVEEAELEEYEEGEL